MGTTSKATPTALRSPVQFVTTHWSAVLCAGETESLQARQALEELCRAYWYPLYAYVRRRGYSPPDAQDLTQEFFAHMLARRWLARADQAKGRFRTFLLSALECFLANEWNKARALKRGGGRQILPLELPDGETNYSAEPADARTPEQAFERRWALTLLEEVLRQLEAEYREGGKAEMFVALRPALVCDRGDLSYPELARQLSVSESAIKVAVHRLRKAYRERLRTEIAKTVATVAEVEAEMRHLFYVLTRPEG